MTVGRAYGTRTIPSARFPGLKSWATLIGPSGTGRRRFVQTSLATGRTRHLELTLPRAVATGCQGAFGWTT
jgi:hypothetical protein